MQLRKTRSAAPIAVPDAGGQNRREDAPQRIGGQSGCRGAVDLGGAADQIGVQPPSPREAEPGTGAPATAGAWVCPGRATRTSTLTRVEERSLTGTSLPTIGALAHLDAPSSESR